jgi:hypothetical protein
MAEWGTRSLVLKIGSTDFSSAVSKVRIKSGDTDADFISFADAAAGGARKYTLVMTLKQDNATSSLWSYAWTGAGTTVAYEVWPNGRPVSGTATVTQPKFTGNVVVMEPDGDFIGGDADPAVTKYFTTEYEWTCVGKPTLGIA